MSNVKGGLPLNQFAELSQMSAAQMEAILSDYSTPQTIDPFKERFSFADALEIEVARQLHDDSGVPLTEGLRLAAYTMAVRSFLDAQSADSSSDFWLAVTSTRNTWGNEPPGSWPITGFGPKEYWAEMHYVGSLGAIMGDILLSFGQDQVSYPNSDPARIVMTNVSAAYRRLRKRAIHFGVEIRGDDFA